MEIKKNIIRLFFSLAILAAIGLHSAHGFSHLAEFSQEKHCIHHYNHSKTDLQHNHKSEHCFACEFVFSSAVNFDSSFNYSFVKSFNFKNSFFQLRDKTISFQHAFFSLRAPPKFIV